MLKFKLGDRVQIIKDSVADACNFVSTSLVGKKGTITYALPHIDGYCVTLDEDKHKEDAELFFDGEELGYVR